MYVRKGWFCFYCFSFSHAYLTWPKKSQIESIANVFFLYRMCPHPLGVPTSAQWANADCLAQICCCLVSLCSYTWQKCAQEHLVDLCFRKDCHLQSRDKFHRGTMVCSWSFALPGTLVIVCDQTAFCSDMQNYIKFPSTYKTTQKLLRWYLLLCNICLELTATSVRPKLCPCWIIYQICLNDFGSCVVFE